MSHASFWAFWRKGLWPLRKSASVTGTEILIHIGEPAVSQVIPADTAFLTSTRILIHIGEPSVSGGSPQGTAQGGGGRLRSFMYLVGRGFIFPRRTSNQAAQDVKLLPTRLRINIGEPVIHIAPSYALHIGVPSFHVDTSLEDDLQEFLLLFP